MTTRSGQALALPADSPLRGLAGRPTLVVLLRSFGCTFCREAMADVAAAKHAIHDAGANIAFVHGASSIEAAPWFTKYGLDDVMAVSDPTLAHYRRSAWAAPARRAGRSHGLGARRGLRTLARLRRADGGDDAAAAGVFVVSATASSPSTVTAPAPIVPTTSRSFSPQPAKIDRSLVSPLEDSCPFVSSRRP